jgi:hypothetical protein
MPQITMIIKRPQLIAYIVFVYDSIFCIKEPNGCGGMELANGCGGLANGCTELA